MTSVSYGFAPFPWESKPDASLDCDRCGHGRHTHFNDWGACHWADVEAKERCHCAEFAEQDEVAVLESQLAEARMESYRWREKAIGLYGHNDLLRNRVDELKNQNAAAAQEIGMWRANAKRGWKSWLKK